MWCRRIPRFAVLAALLGLTATLAVFAQTSSHRGRKYKAPPATSRIEVTILRNDDGDPIENASVIFHLVGDKGNMELKTNEDGKTVIDVLPTGSKVLLQVIAKGYQTYGQDYEINKAEMAIEIKLKRPGQQYSIYQHHDQTADAGKDGAAKNPANDSANGSKATSSDKPAGAASQTGDKPATSQPQPQ
ncbi:MAG: carboxypeptidase regulatory-like domain-containing protein [Acidobacteriota bacterium]|nr:carboxypeptidase regulatory-like domain-containing protein [Acidobacteriota bacterium]